MAAKPTPVTRAITELMPDIDGLTTLEIYRELVRRGVDIPESAKSNGSREKKQIDGLRNTLNGFRQGKNPRLISHTRDKTTDDDPSTVRWYRADRPPQKKIMHSIGPRTLTPDPPSPLAKPAKAAVAAAKPPEDKAIDIRITLTLTPYEACRTRDMLRQLAPLMHDTIGEKLMILYYGFRNAIGETA